MTQTILKNNEFITKSGKIKRARFNIHYFDQIDTPEKAYWIGFIWCDGYTAQRIRNGHLTESNLKISLHQDDIEHLKKFNNAIDGDFNINLYRGNGFRKGKYVEARLLIINHYFVSVLRDKYGIVSNRSDSSKLLNAIPQNLFIDFIRGILDADGSFTYYQITEKNKIKDKLIVHFGSNENIVRAIEQYLINQQYIADLTRKLYKRHSDRDGEYITLSLSGIHQNLQILSLLYDNACVYLDRKYNKYLTIKQQLGR